MKPIFLRPLVLVGLVLLPILSLQTQLLASNPFESLIRGVWRTINPPGPGQRTVVNANASAGTRTEICSADIGTPPLTALVRLTPYQSRPTSGFVWEVTVSVTPQLWFYVPYNFQNDLRLSELVILDENRNPILSEPIIYGIENTPGIIKIELPPALERNRDYTWYFSIICDEERPARNPVVNGQIRRITPSETLLLRLDEVSSEDVFVAYLENDIWHEMATSLATEYLGSPNNIELRNNWQSMVEFLDLSQNQADQIKEAPIIQCCEPLEN